MSDMDDIKFASVLISSMTPEERSNLVAAALRLADDLQAAIQSEIDQ